MMQTEAYAEQSAVSAYPATPLPQGVITLNGSSGGLSFPMNVHPNSTFLMFDATFNRPLNVSYLGERLRNRLCKSYKAVQHIRILHGLTRVRITDYI